MTRRTRAIIAVLFALGLAGFVLAGVFGDDGGTDPVVSGNTEIEDVVPSPGAEVLQQQTVAVDLAAGFRVTSMRISPTESPGDSIDVTAEMEVVSGLNVFSFVPGDGKLIEALSPDTNCVYVIYVEQARPETTATVDWCFEVV